MIGEVRDACLPGYKREELAGLKGLSTSNGDRSAESKSYDR